ncbi:MAG: hypothetical protein IJG16_06565 [Clostridia bacterium]|nr:hypothetical protein [Clostridia bacterium]
MASKEEVLDLYTRIIRGQEVDPVTLQAAKALGRHYGIDTPSDEPQGGDVIIVDDIDLSVCRQLAGDALSTALSNENKIFFEDDRPGLKAAYSTGVKAMYSQFMELLSEAEKYPATN